MNGGRRETFVQYKLNHGSRSGESLIIKPMHEHWKGHTGY
jgi:hypothetical protein